MTTNAISPTTLTPSQAHWPRQLNERLGRAAPSQIWAIGRPEILAKEKIGLFCSVGCPEDVAVRAYNACRRFRDEGMTLISGYHSPVEKECLRILLEGNQPIILCLARSLIRIRLQAEWQKALEASRLLLLSRFEKSRRADKETARRRNELVAALADEALVIHAEQGGGIEKISAMIDQWGVPKIDILKGP
jgi:predicted Rossmann fold nucleotide-binding protein DprA/Smf involved in DNA uptake